MIMKVTKKLQKKFLREKLSTNQKWAKIALIRIYNNQTDDEQRCENVKVINGVGFTGIDGQILSSFANQLLTKNYLSPKQTTILMLKMKKYWKQILMISDIEKLNSQIIMSA